MKIEKFEDLTFWKESIDIATEIHKIFEKNKDFGFKGELYRILVAIPNNIVAGFERRINAEFKEYLCVAKGLNSELRSMMHLGKNLGHIEESDFQKLYDKSVGISKMIGGFIKSLK